MTPAQILVELWPKIHTLCPEIKVEGRRFGENLNEASVTEWVNSLDMDTSETGAH